jgi:hypothetical protein
MTRVLAHGTESNQKDSVGFDWVPSDGQEVWQWVGIYVLELARMSIDIHNQTEAGEIS